jgi:lysophospholipase L1-like esterase
MKRTTAHVYILTVTSLLLVTSSALGQVVCASNQASATRKTSAAGPLKRSLPTAFTGSWSTGLTTVSIDNIQGQTLRELMRASIGGTSARIGLSNLYGTGPVTFTDVHMARSSGFNQLSTVAGTDHQVTFGGASTVTLQAGCEVESDGIQMTIAPLAEYAVSMFFQDAAGTSVTSGLSDPTDGTPRTDTFVLAGDVSSDQNPTSALVGPLGAYYFLSNLQVQNTAAAGTVVAIGASITQGRHTTGEAPNRWTDLLSQRINSAGLVMGVENMGIAGNNMLTNELAFNSGDSLLDRFSHDVLQQANVKAVIISDDPINDLLSDTITPELSTQLIDAYQTLISQAHAANIKVICSTLTPFGSDTTNTNTPSAQQPREQINTFLTSPTSGCDALFDQAKAEQNPDNVIDLLPAFNTFPNPDGDNPPDGLHPNDSGHQAIANAFNLGNFTATGVPPITAPTTPGELPPGQGLLPGQSLLSQDGRFTLTLNENGSLTLFEGTVVLWSQGAVGNTPSELIFQGDGNLVEYGPTGKILWQSGSTGAQGTVFVEQNDGNLVIYNAVGMPIFGSDTCCH